MKKKKVTITLDQGAVNCLVARLLVGIKKYGFVNFTGEYEVDLLLNYDHHALRQLVEEVIRSY